jgi:hypothetical protein
MRNIVVELGNCLLWLLWGLLLTLMTCGLGIIGAKGWNGESGGNALALFGVPMLVGWRSTNSFTMGIAAQAVVCLGLTFLIRERLRRTSGLAANGAPTITPSGSTNPLIIAVMIALGLAAMICFAGYH